MKKTLYILASLTAVLFVSCAKEVDVKEEPVEEGTLVTGTTLRAAVEGVDTKVSANAVGEYKWQASDKIAVLDNAGDVYEFTAASAGSTSEFSCASSITLGSYAAYPYSTSFTASGNAVTFEIPSTITYSADATNMPMLGKISGDNVTFKAVGGLLKLIVYGVPSGSTRLEFAAKAQKINGSFAIADASIAAPVIATADKGASDNTITIDYTGKYNANMVFYIPLPTGTIEGFDLTFNDAGNTTKSVSVNLTVARNTIILAPTLNMFTPSALFSETFTTDLTGSGSPATVTVVAYNAEKKGQTVAGGATVDYSINSIEGTKVYVDQNLAKGAAAGELLLGQKVSSTNGEFYITGIPTLGNSNATLTFVANNNTASRSGVSSPTEGVSVFNRTTTGTAAPYTISYTISIASGVDDFDLTFSNSTGNNVRIDDISITSAAPAPAISFAGTGTRTIAAASLTASSTVDDVTLSGAVDGTGIGVTSNVSWLSGTLSGTTLTITASEYNHTKADREGKIYLKATGATTQEITVTQKPTIVPSPSLGISGGNQTFTLSWTPNEKAGSYVAYYSTTADLADPTSGTTPLTINTSTTPYTAVPSVDLTNGTTYYIYVRVYTVAAEFADVYGAPVDNWATTSVTPNTGGGDPSWTRVTTTKEITDGGTFIIGYEASAKSGTLIPLRPASAGAYIYSGSTSDNTATITMSSTMTASSTADYETEIVAGPTSGTISIMIGTKYIKNNCSYDSGKKKWTHAITLADTKTDTGFTPSIGDNDVVTLTSTIQVNSQYAKFQYNTGSPRFTCYGTGSQKNLVLYKKGE